MSQAIARAADSGITLKTGLAPRAEHIYPILYIEAIVNRDALDKYESTYRVLKRANINVQRAIRGGVWALDREIYRHLSSAKNDGKLLMCWEGSKVVDLDQGGAA